MSDPIQFHNRKLSNEAKQFEKAGQFAEAADLYKQVPVTVEQKRETGNTMSDIRLIHFADIHLGFTGPANLILSETENVGLEL